MPVQVYNKCPSGSPEQRVVFDHLHLLHPNQVQHVIDLQRSLRISYEDLEMEYIRNEIEKNLLESKKALAECKTCGNPSLGGG